MKKIKKVCYIPWIGTPKENKVFKNNKNSWEHILYNNLKQKGINIFTDDMVKVSESDACITFDNMYYKNLESIWEMYYNKKLENSIYIDYEPPTGHCKNHNKKGIKKLSKIFKYVITYDDKLVDGKSIIKGNIANFYAEELDYNNDFGKRNLVCMITNCTTQKQIISILNYYNSTIFFNKYNTRRHTKELYSKRYEVASFFANKCPEEFGLFGALWPDKFTNVYKGYVKQTNKLVKMNKYKFIISIDSYDNNNGYISEKIFDAFKAKVIPIYLGDSKISKYIPKDCYVDFRDFNNLNELYSFMKSMTELEYNKYIDSIEKFLNSNINKKFFSSEASAKIIEKALLTPKKKFDYNEAYKSLMYFERKKMKIEKKRKINFYLTKYDNEGKNISLMFFIEYFGKYSNGDFRIYANNKEIIIKMQKKEERKTNNSYYYEFEVDFDDVDKNVDIKIYFVSSGRTYKLYFDNLNSGFANSCGIYPSLNKRKIIYYKKYFYSKKHKLFILLLRDQKRLIEYVNREIFQKTKNKIIKFIQKNKIYKYIIKIEKRSKMSIIDLKWWAKLIVIMYRIIKLPFIIISDFFKIFYIK